MIRHAPGRLTRCSIRSLPLFIAYPEAHQVGRSGHEYAGPRIAGIVEGGASRAGRSDANLVKQGVTRSWPGFFVELVLVSRVASGSKISSRIKSTKGKSWPASTRAESGMVSRIPSVE
jgi:hypothetical protein